MPPHVRLSQRTDGLCSCGQPVQLGKCRSRAGADKNNAAVMRSKASNPDDQSKQFNNNATKNNKKVSSICMAMHGHQIQVLVLLAGHLQAPVGQAEMGEGVCKMWGAPGAPSGPY